MRPLENTTQYDIMMRCNNGGSKVFRTLDLVADGTRELRGKGTRAWKAVEVIDGKECGRPVVLKDAWVDIARPQEGETTARVCEIARPAGPDSELQGSFLTVDCHGDVYLDDERSVIDCTRRFCLKDGATVCVETPQHRSTPLDDTQVALSRCLVHYRIVFQEICSPISEETSAAMIFRALTDIARSELFLCCMLFLC